MTTTGTVACLCGTVHVISTGSVVRPGQRYCPKCAPRIADDPWNAAPADSAQATHPCGCPADTVTTPLRGFRAQCGSCAAVFDVPAPDSDSRPYVKPASGSRAEMNAELYDQH